MSKLIYLYCFFIGNIGVNAQSEYNELGFGHAHNDYAKLFRKDYQKAMEMGCHSLEIDVFAVKGKLKVAHLPLFLFAKRSFEKRYLLPLISELTDANPYFFEDSLPLILMIDLKSRPEEAYEQLRALAKKYASYFCYYQPQTGEYHHGPIQLLISGKQPYLALSQDSIWYMQIDGRLGDLDDSSRTAALVPRISDRYSKHFSWRGRGAMPPDQLAQLKELVQQTHAAGRQLRFWAMPNRPVVWQTFLEAGVDWLNVDKVKRLRRWSDEYYKK